MSNKHKIQHLYISSLSFPSNGNVKVAMGSFAISFKSTETNGVYSYHFVLITGFLNEKRFGYSSHRATDYNSSYTKLKTLRDTFRIILEDINRYNTTNDLDDPTINLKEKLEVNHYKYLYKKLKNNLIILPTVPYLLNNEDEAILEFFSMKIH